MESCETYFMVTGPASCKDCYRNCDKCLIMQYNVCGCDGFQTICIDCVGKYFVKSFTRDEPYTSDDEKE